MLRHVWRGLILFYPHIGIINYAPDKSIHGIIMQLWHGQINDTRRYILLPRDAFQFTSSNSFRVSLVALRHFCEKYVSKCEDKRFEWFSGVTGYRYCAKATSEGVAIFGKTLPLLFVLRTQHMRVIYINNMECVNVGGLRHYIIILIIITLKHPREVGARRPSDSVPRGIPQDCALTIKVNTHT